MNEESKYKIAAAVRFIGVSLDMPLEDVRAARLTIAMNHISNLLKVIETQQAELDSVNEEASEASVIVQRLREENDRLSKMMAGDLPF